MLGTRLVALSFVAICFASPLSLDAPKPPLPAVRHLAVRATPNGCGWWDPLGVCHAAEAAVQKLLDAIPWITEDIKAAVMQVVDQLFDKLSDVLEKFESAVLRIEKQSVDDAKKLIALVEASIKAVTDHIIAKVEELVGKSAAEITAACEAIINDVSSLVDSIFAQITGALHDFEQFAWQTLCTGEGMIKQLELFVSASSMTASKTDCDCVHKAAVWAVDSCADSCTCAKGILHPYRCACGVAGWATVEDQNLYYAIRCKAEKEVEAGLAQNKTADWIAAKLGSIADLGYQLQCYHFSSAGTIGNWYANQALALTQAVNIWVPPNRAVLQRLATPPTSTTEIATLVEQVRSLMATVQLQQRQIEALHRSPPPLRTVQAMVTAGDCTTAFECWTEALQRLQTAEQMVDDALNKTRIAESRWEKVEATLEASFEHKYNGEMKVFNTSACPDGWQEVDATKGYVLVSRPKDAKTGDHKNKPLSKDEISRIGPHSHFVSVTTKPHTHGITDHGHVHSIPIRTDDKHGGGIDQGEHGTSAKQTTNVAKTGVTVNTASAEVDVSVQSAGSNVTSEGYPLAYVLLCQRVTQRK